MATGADFDGASDFVKQRDTRVLSGRRVCSERVNLLNMTLVVILNVLEVIVFISLDTRAQADEQKQTVVIINSLILTLSVMLTISLRIFGHNRCKCVMGQKLLECTRVALGCMIGGEAVIIGLQIANELLLTPTGLESYALKASVVLLLVIFVCLLLQYNCLVPPDTPRLPEKEPLVVAEQSKAPDFVIAQLPDLPPVELEEPKDGLTDAERAWRDEAEGKSKPKVAKPKPSAPKPKPKETVILSAEELAWRAEAEVQPRFAAGSGKNPSWAKHSGLN